MYRNDLPHNELPLLPPPLELIASRQVATKLNLASRALGELKASANNLPNPLILVQTLALQEAKESSEIENILTTHDELYRAMAAPNESRTTPQTKEVLRYREALSKGLELLTERPLSTSLILRIQETLIGDQAGIRKQSGTIIRNDKTNETIYTPPQGEEVIYALLDNLTTYLHHDDESSDPLIRMAVAHYQFEAIHPFYDGNGRTGRIVNILYLIEQGLLSQPVLYLSAYFLRERSTYYSLLRLVTENAAWVEWTAFVLEGIRQTAIASLAKIEAIRVAMDKVRDLIRMDAPSIDSLDLLLALFAFPYTTNVRLSNELNVNYLTARKYLKKLTEIGVVIEQRHNRENYYLNSALIDLLGSPLLS